MKRILITDWEKWVEICEGCKLNPLGTVDFAVDICGGNSEKYIYLGGYPADYKKIIVEQKPEIDEKFIQNKTNQMEQMFMQKQKREDREYFIRQVYQR